MFSFLKPKKESRYSYFTSEMVSPGHPDKVMDTIAESVVDYVLEHEKHPRIAVDGVCKNNWITLVGEISTNVKIPFRKIVTDSLKCIGYTADKSPLFNNENVFVKCNFTKQSPDIAQGVDHTDKESAGDIGMMLCGAVKEAPDYTPWSHYLARLINFKLYQQTLNDNLDWARPDQKTQVTIKYKDGVPCAIDNIVVCISHAANVGLDFIYNTISEHVELILAGVSFPKNFDWKHYILKVNPTGAFASYGPIADSGEVGRKIVCDQTGSYFSVGGGNLNGKDATKVDRAGVYMCRYVAKQIVSKGFATKCQIQVAYTIGQLEPASINVECFGTNIVPIEQIDNFVKLFSFIPGDIIKRFNLNSPIEQRKFQYRDLGAFGHIGERFDGTKLPWENC